MDERLMGEALRRYVVTEILEGDGEGLDGQTPLLEWGILNSMEMVRLLAFIGREFAAPIDPAEVTPAHFRNIDEIVSLVRRRMPEKERND